MSAEIHQYSAFVQYQYINEEKSEFCSELLWFLKFAP